MIGFLAFLFVCLGLAVEYEEFGAWNIGLIEFLLLYAYSFACLLFLGLPFLIILYPLNVIYLGVIAIISVYYLFRITKEKKKGKFS